MAEPDVIDVVGGVGVDVVPRADQWGSRLRAATLPEAEKVGREIAQRIGAAIVGQVTKDIREGIRNGGRAALSQAQVVGRQIGARIGRAARAAIEAALRRVSVDITANLDLAGVRARLAAVTGATVNIDADVGAAEAKLTALSAKIAALSGSTVNVDVDTIAAQAKIAALQAAVTAVGTSANIEVKAKVTGTAAMNRFVTALNDVNAAASASPIRVEVRADVDGGAEIRRLRTNMAALAAMPPVAIGLRVDGVLGAVQEINLVRAMVQRLRNERPTVTVDVDITAAVLRLAVVLGLLGAVGAQHPTINVNIDLSTALAQLGLLNHALLATQANAARTSGSLSLLVLIGITLLPLLVPVAAAAAAAIGGIAVAALAVGAALGVGVLAFSGIIGAVQAMSAANKAGGKSAAEHAQRQSQLASAAASVRSAERGLTNANRDALRAQKDLTKARREAKEALEDLAFANTDNSIQQREAALDLADAERELRQVKGDPGSSPAEKERAQIAYDRALLQRDRLKTEGGRLADRQADAVKKGIEQSDQVVAAQDRIRAAQERVVEATEAVAAAHRQMAQAAMSASSSAGGAADDLRKKLAALSPEGQRFAKFLFSIRGQFGGLRKAAERGFLPGVEAGIRAWLPMLPQVERFISTISSALGDLAKRAGQALTSPFWQEFFGWLAGTASRELKGFGTIVGNLAEGFGALLMAFGPTSEGMIEGLADMTQGFADWAKSVGESNGFKKFIAYVQENGPKALSLIGDILGVAIKLGIGLAPLGSLMLTGLTVLFDWLNKQNPAVLIGIAAGLGAIGIAFQIMVGGPIALVVVGILAIVAALVYCYTHFKTFRDIVDAVWSAIAKASVWLWKTVLKPTFDAIVWLIMDVVVPAAIWLWKNAIKPTWDAIATASLWLWRNILKPTFDAISWFVREILGPVFSWLYEHVVKPAWTGIQVSVSIAWAIIKVIFGLVQIALKILGEAFLFLWKWVIKPTWDGIAETVMWVWDHLLKPTFEAFGGFIEKYVAPAFKRGVEALGRIWDGLVDFLKIPVRFIVETVLNDGLLAAYNWIAKRFGVKPDDVRVNLPASFNTSPKSVASPGGRGQSRAGNLADGGYISGPGGPRDDLIPAWLSNGEFVMPAHRVAELGVNYLENLRRGNGGPRNGQDGLPGFAEGGFVGFLRKSWDAITDPVGFLKEQAANLLKQVPGGKWLHDTMAGVGQKIVTGVIDRVSAMLSASSSGGDDFGAGPGFPPWPSSPGASRGDSGVWRSIVALIKSTGPMSGSFGNGYRHGDPLWHGSGRAVDWMGFNQDRLASFLSTKRPLELIHRTNGQDFAFTRGVDKGSFNERLMEQHRNHIHIAMRNGGFVSNMLPVMSYDDGGWLLPGLNYTFNGTGGPEPVLTDRQWALLNEGRGGGDTYTTNIYPQRANFDQRELEAFEARRAVQLRVGRRS